MALNLKDSLLILCNLPAKMQSSSLITITSYKQIQTSSNPPLSGEEHCFHRQNYRGNSEFSCVWSGNRFTGVTSKWSAVCLVSFAIGWLHLLPPCFLLSGVHHWKHIPGWFSLSQKHESHIAASCCGVGFWAHSAARISAAGPVKISGVWLTFCRRISKRVGSNISFQQVLEVFQCDTWDERASECTRLVLLYG